MAMLVECSGARRRWALSSVAPLVLGRLEIDAANKGISRQHLRFETRGGAVLVEQRGALPSRVSRRAGAAETALARGESAELGEGACVVVPPATRGAPEYRFTVELDPAAAPALSSPPPPPAAAAAPALSTVPFRARDYAHAAEVAARYSLPAAQPSPSPSPAPASSPPSAAAAEPETNAFSLAFHSISTDEAQFAVSEAVPELVAAADAFLASCEDARVRLVLVIDPDDRNRAHLEEGVAPLVRRAGGRLTVHVGFITALHLHSLPCRFLACATSWRFRAAGAPASRAVFDCAGAALTADAVAAHRTAAVGRAYAVRLRGDSPLRRTGAQAVLLVAGPNMNPDRPDCLAGDYKAGRALLRRCYDSLFDAFRSQAGLPRAWEWAEAAAVPELAAPRVAKRARAAPEAVAKGEEEEEEEENGGESEEEKRKEAAAASAVAASAASSEGDDEELGPLPELRPPSVAEFEALAPAGGDWRNALGRIMRELPRCRRLVFAETRDVVVVYDRYPKARVHLLALPRPSARLEVEGGPAALRATPETLATLAALKRVGEWVAVGLRRRLGAEAGGALGVRCGFHAQPSLSYLHMHIVSQDFDSPHLKHKHHWNSFTSPFFLEPDALADMVRAGTNALLTSTRAAEFAALLDRPLACHVCRAEVRTMPRLKEHVAACLRRTAAAGRV